MPSRTTRQTVPVQRERLDYFACHAFKALVGAYASKLLKSRRSKKARTLRLRIVQESDSLGRLMMKTIDRRVSH